MVARHNNRPTLLDYVSRLFTEFTATSGDRRFADDHAIVAGFARYKDSPVLIVGHHKGGGGACTHTVVDADGDGFGTASCGVASPGTDCDDGNASIHPGIPDP